ncbi:hypothetical protein GCM10009798_32580 [Nocardioides panacihumi]|uniref:DUF4082 domain-containing protein n=1 Tax=Nocardioides panacihumi TaxID=400774 RepID=A0ABN2RHW3_9ACTN
MKHTEPRSLRHARKRLALIFSTVVAVATALGISLLVQPGANAAEETVFPNTAPPAHTDPDRTSVELGMRFSVTVPGTVVGVKYYGTDKNTGTHTGSLWSASGKRLATATFKSSTGAGWQSVGFATPVHVDPGQTYTASYLAPTGRYAVDDWGFKQGVTRNHITVPRNGGVYAYGATGGFPRDTWKSANYFVDVRFVPDAVSGVATSTTTSVPTGTATGSPASTPTSAPPTTSTSTPTQSPSKTVTPTPTPTAPATTTAPASPSTSAAPTQNGCAAAPSKCGFPDSSNTGPAAGTVFRSVPGDVTSGPGWTYDPRGWITVDGDGAVLENLDIRGISIEVHSSNVTIRNNRLTVVGENWAVGMREGTNIHVTHNLITAPSATGTDRGLVAVKDIFGKVVDPVVDHNDISRMSTGIQMDAGTVADNYIHDMGYKSGDHLNGFTSNGGTRPLVIDHNTIFNSYDQTDAISLFQDFDVQANRRVTNNLIGGGGYTIYAGGGPKGTSNHITVTGNRFARTYFPNSGHWGPVTAWDANGTGNTWSGNIWDDNGAGVSGS